MDLLDLNNTHPLDQNSDFSALFATGADWDELQESWMQSLSSIIDSPQNDNQPTGNAPDANAVSSPSTAVTAPDQAQLEIHREIDEVDDRITQYELEHMESAEDESLLELKLWKAQLRLRLQQLRNAPRDRALLSLQLEEVQLQMRLRKIRCKAVNGSADDLEDDGDYVSLNVRRLELRDELAQIPKAGQIPNSSLEPNQVPQQVCIPEVLRHS